MKPPRLCFSLVWALFLAARIAVAAPVPLSAIPLSDGKMTPTRSPETFDDVRVADIENGAPDGDPIVPGLILPLDRPVCFRGYFVAEALVSQLDGKVPVEVDRLVVGAAPFLERVVLGPGAEATQVTVRSRAVVPLVRLDIALPAYAYRTDRAARWAATMQQASVFETPSSAPAAQAWTVNVSVSKVSRDPEPLVSVFAQPTPAAE